MIYTKFVVLQTLMLHVKFQGNWPSGSWEENVLGFEHFWAWQPSWSCDRDHLYKLLFPFLKEAPQKFGFDRVRRRRCLTLLTMTTTKTTNADAWVYYKLTMWLRWTDNVRIQDVSNYHNANATRKDKTM